MIAAFMLYEERAGVGSATTGARERLGGTTSTAAR